MDDNVTFLLKLLDEHGAKLLGLFTRLTLCAADAEDLLQELFLKLRDANGFARAQNPKAYAFRTAIHLAFDWRRKRQSTELLSIELQARSDSAIDRLISAEEFEEVLNVVQSLPSLCREVVVLRFLEHQEYPEIARHVGKTEHQVRGLCARAMTQLRSEFRPTAKISDIGVSEP